MVLTLPISPQLQTHNPRHPIRVLTHLPSKSGSGKANEPIQSPPWNLMPEGARKVYSFCWDQYICRQWKPEVAIFSNREPLFLHYLVMEIGRDQKNQLSYLSFYHARNVYSAGLAMIQLSQMSGLLISG